MLSQIQLSRRGLSKKYDCQWKELWATIYSEFKCTVHLGLPVDTAYRICIPHRVYCGLWASSWHYQWDLYYQKLYCTMLWAVGRAPCHRLQWISSTEYIWGFQLILLIEFVFPIECTVGYGLPADTTHMIYITHRLYCIVGRVHLRFPADITHGICITQRLYGGHSTFWASSWYYSYDLYYP